MKPFDAFEQLRKDQEVARKQKINLFKRAKKIKHNAGVINKKEKSKDLQNLEQQLAKANTELTKQKALNKKSRQQHIYELKRIKQKNKALTKQIDQTIQATQDLIDQKDIEIRKKEIDLAFKEEQINEAHKFWRKLGFSENLTVQENLERQANFLNLMIGVFVKKEQKYNSLLDEQTYLNSKIKFLKKENDALTYNETFFEQQAHHLSQVNKQQHDELKQLKKKYIYDSQVIPKTFNRLITQLNTDTFNQYVLLDDLNQKFTKIFNKLTKESSLDNAFLYGYLELDNGVPFIHSLNNNLYPIEVTSAQKHNPNYYNGVAIKVRKFNEGKSFQLIRMYNLATHIRHIPKKKPKRKITQNVVAITKQDEVVEIVSPYKLAWLKNLHITVIGNKRVQVFEQEIRKYCKTRLYDAYEDQEREIWTGMQWADYVFILIDSVPHSITDYTKTQKDLHPGSTKVQIFRNPNRYDGILRLNYLFEQAH